MRRLGIALVLGMLMSMAPVFADETAPRPSIQQEIDQIREKLNDLSEQVNDPEGTVKVTEAAVKKQMKIGWSGYLQLRFESPQGTKTGGASEQFTVRRARLKITAKPSADVLAVASMDLGQGKQEDKDLYLTWYPYHSADRGFALTVGQMNLPFGLEVPVSSSVRESPERALWSRTLFPGERDLGIKFSTPSGKPLALEVGLFNGAGINKPDENNGKVIVGRLGFSPNDFLDLGASVYTGVASTKLGSDATNRRKERVGADVRLLLTEGIALKGEYVQGREMGLNPVGWLAQVNCNLGTKTVLVGKFDLYDDDGLSAAGTVKTWNVGLIRYLDPNLKVRCFYEMPRESKVSVKNDTLRLEAVVGF